MLSDLLDQFLERSAKARYSIISCIFILLALISYYLFVRPVIHDYHAEQQVTARLRDEIATAESQLRRYPDREPLLANLAIAEPRQPPNQLIKLIAQQILYHQLTLIDFQQSLTAAEGIQLHFKIQGDYPQFISFISTLAQLDLALTLRQMSVVRQLEQTIFFLAMTYPSK